MAEDESKGLKYPLLVVEDDEDNLRLYVNAIKSACQGQVQLNIARAICAERACELLRTRLYPFISLDQNIPEKPGGPIKSDYGVAVGELALKTQPFLMATVFTGFENVPAGTRFASKGIEYVPKSTKTAREYAQHFAQRIRSFEAEGIWKCGSDELPPAMAAYCLGVLQNTATNAVQRLDQALHFYETTVDLLLLQSLAICQALGESMGELIQALPGRLDMGAVLNIGQKALALASNAVRGAGFGVQSRELSRAFEHSQFFEAASVVHRLRNRRAHSPTTDVEAAEAFETNKASFITLLLGSSFWALHPMVTNVRLIPWGSRMALEGQPLKGSGSYVKRQIWDWDQRLVIVLDRPYQLILDPENPERAVTIPLFPLVRTVVTGKQPLFYFAHHPARDEYRDPLTGSLHTFKDQELSRWWFTQQPRRRDRSSFLPASSFPSPQPQPARATARTSNVTTDSSTREIPLRQMIAETVRDFYLPELDDLPKQQQDKDYQETFDGESKAARVLKYLDQLANVNLARMAYVSAGGGDGSELAFVMKNRAVQYGVMIEFSDFGVDDAKKRSAALAAEGKELVVLQGDLMQRLEDCSDRLRAWLAAGHIDGVILSAQAVIHELPFRSPQYDANLLLGKIFEPFTLRVFVCREPALPQGWPAVVHLRIGNLPGRTLTAVSRQVKDVLGFDGRVDNLADDYVQMSSELAVESLFKVLYWQSDVRHRYEMEERLTSFNPTEFAKILGNFIRPSVNIDVQYMASDTFTSLYRQFQVSARSVTGDALPLPKPFVMITGFHDERPRTVAHTD